MVASWMFKHIYKKFTSLSLKLIDNIFQSTNLKNWKCVQQIICCHGEGKHWGLLNITFSTYLRMHIFRTIVNLIVFHLLLPLQPPITPCINVNANLNEPWLFIKLHILWIKSVIYHMHIFYLKLSFISILHANVMKSL